MWTKLGKIVSLLLLCLTLVATRRLPTATILPFGRGNNDKEKRESPPESFESRKDPHDRQNRPPPPPPPPLQAGNGVEANEEKLSDTGQFQNPEHPPQFWAPEPFQPYGGDPPPQGWMGPPSDWSQHQQSQWGQQTNMDNCNNADMEAFLVREAALLTELENTTALLSAYAQRDDLHMRQLDVLTERVMDVEAAAAKDRNLSIEFQANCTELGRTVALLQDEIEEWTSRCRNLTTQNERGADRLAKVKAELKERNREVEDLATMIESARLDSERDRYLVERNSRKKKRGFFAWLFGISSREEDDEEKLQVRCRHGCTLLFHSLPPFPKPTKECTGVREINIASCSSN